VVFSPDARRFAALRQGTVWLGDSQRASLSRSLAELGDHNTCLLFSRDNRRLYAGTSLGQVRVWSLAGTNVERVLFRQSGQVWLLKEDELSRCLLAVQEVTGFEPSTQARYQVWGSSTWSLRQSIPYTNVALACAISAGGRTIVTSHFPNGLQLWDGGTGARIDRVMLGGPAHEMAFSPDGRFLAACTEDGAVYVWDTVARHTRAVAQGPATFHGLSFSSDGRRLAAGADGKDTVEIWETAGWQPLIVLEGRPPGRLIAPLAFPQDTRAITAVNWRNEAPESSVEILRWEVPDLVEIDTAEGRDKFP